MRSLAGLRRTIVGCRACPRLVAHRERVAREKVRRFADWTYWGRPVPGFGDPDARVLVVGLAPAAHGANRTGRIFTGDESGNWLYRAMHRAGLASQAESTHAKDGLVLRDAWVTCVGRCAPPGNRPTREELASCRAFLATELRLLRRLRVVVALGGIAHAEVLATFAARGDEIPRPRPRFAHGACHRLPSGLVLLDSYHPSQQNTFTGRLTRAMLDAVLDRAVRVQPKA